MSAIIALKKAIYTLLTNNGLTVSTGLPLNTKLPYVQVGGIDITDSSVKLINLNEYLATYHVWEWAYNEENFYNILDKTINLILNKMPTLESPYELEDSSIVMSEVIFDKTEKEIVLHGVIKFNFKITNNNE